MKPLKFFSLVIFIITALIIPSCTPPPTTYIFITGDTPAPTLTPIQTLENPTNAPGPTEAFTPTAQTIQTLKVVPSVDPVCNGSKLIEVNVHLEVSGGVPPYLLEGKEINPSQPIKLSAGGYTQFNIASSDGQALPVKVWAPSSCVDASQDEGTTAPHPNPTSTNPPVIPDPPVDPTDKPPVNPTVVQPTTQPTNPPVIPTIETPPVVIIDTPFKFQCSDGKDNDSDNLIDLEDPQCKNKRDDDESK